MTVSSRKGGTNKFPSQIKRCPKAPAPMTKKKLVINPMETAPRDGSVIMLTTGYGYYYVRSWSKKRKAWVDYPDGDVDYDQTGGYQNEDHFTGWCELPHNM